AGWLGCDFALVFSSGYLANVAAVRALAGPGSLIVSDAHNHASLVDGCRIASAGARGSRTVVVPHADLPAVRASLAPPSRRRAGGRGARVGLLRRRRPGAAGSPARAVPRPRGGPAGRRRARRRGTGAGRRGRGGRGGTVGRARRGGDGHAVQGARRGRRYRG